MKKITFLLFFLMLSMSSAMALTITDKASIVDLKSKVVTEKAVLSNENQEQIAANDADPALCCETRTATGYCGDEEQEFSHTSCTTHCYTAALSAQSGANMMALAWQYVCTGG